MPSNPLLVVRDILLDVVAQLEALAAGDRSQTSSEQTGRSLHLPTWVAVARVVAYRRNVPLRLLLAISYHESRYNTQAINHETAADRRKGYDVTSVGAFQILYPDTSNALAAQLGVARPSLEQLKDIELNADFAATLVADLLRRFPAKKANGFPSDAVAAYNAGRPRMLDDKTYSNQAYVDAVETAWLRLGAVV